jgi:hypothetical protein
MARRRPAARWIVGTGALVVAGFFTAFALTSAFSGDDEQESAAEDAPTDAQTLGPEPSGTVGVDVSVPTSDGDPETVETVDPIKDTVRAPCALEDFRVLFDRETAALAVFTGDGRQLMASVAPGSYAFAGESCRGVPAGIKPYSDEALQAPVYESGGVSCQSARGVDVEIHLIVSGTTGQQAGNNLVVSIRRRPTVLVSGIVVDELAGRRLSYSSKHCTPL